MRLILVVVISLLTFSQTYARLSSNEVRIENSVWPQDVLKSDFQKNITKDTKGATETVILKTINVRAKRGKYMNSRLEFVYKNAITLAKWEPRLKICWDWCIDNYADEYNKLLDNTKETFIAVVTGVDSKLIKLILLK